MTDWENATEIRDAITAATTDVRDSLVPIAEALDELSTLAERVDALHGTAERIAAALERLTRQQHAASRAAHGESYTMLLEQAERA